MLELKPFLMTLGAGFIIAAIVLVTPGLDRDSLAGAVAFYALYLGIKHERKDQA